MTTRPTLGEQPRHATASPQLRAALARSPAPPPIDITRAQPHAIPDTVPRARRTSHDDRPAATHRHPVRANAVCITANPTLWISLDRNQRASLLFIAEQIERKTKSKGRTDGAVGRSGLVILRVLLWYAGLSKSGRCDPALTTIASKARCCVQTVVSALDRLAGIGLVSVTRRWLRVRDPASGVMVSRQITNGYHFPTGAARFWLPELAPITRSVTATSRRTLRRGVAYFQSLFQRHAGTSEPLLATPLFQGG